MDFGTLIGIISGIVIFLWAIYMGGSISAFIHLPSALIVFGGLLAATLINYHFKTDWCYKNVKNRFYRKTD